MASELQRVAAGLVESFDQVPQVVAALQRTAHRCRQNAVVVAQLTAGDRRGRAIVELLDEAARACEQAAERCATARQVGREWALAMTGIRTDTRGGAATNEAAERGGSASKPEPASRDRPDEASGEVRRSLGDAHPHVADVIERLMADREHPLDLTRALSDPRRREETLDIVRELADGQVLAGRDLDEYRETHPGRGPLFDAVPADVNETETGESRKAQFVAQCKEVDPARRVGGHPTDQEWAAVDDYAERLNDEVLPQVREEIAGLARKVGGTTSVRAKTASDLLDKVGRMSGGSSGRPPRAGYQVGDVLDAVGARITVDATERLERVVAEVRSYYGTGSRGRVLEMANMYAAPKAHNRAYRVVPFMISTEVGGMPYAFELQVCTRRASVASDLEHNTIYKPYVDPTAGERAAVRQMQAEAAALDEEETRRRHR